MLGLTQFVMGQTEIVGAANQVHARVQSVQARSCVPTFARQTGESLTEGSIQAFNKSGIQHVPPHLRARATALPDRADRKPSSG